MQETLVILMHSFNSLFCNLALASFIILTTKALLQVDRWIHLKTVVVWLDVFIHPTTH